MSARARHHLAVFARDGSGCAMRRFGGCEGPGQADHILKESVLRRWQGQLQRRLVNGEKLRGRMLAFARADLEEVIADPRNGWVLCMNGHHAPKDRKLLRGREHTAMVVSIPAHFFAFVKEWGLEHLANEELGTAL